MSRSKLVVFALCLVIASPLFAIPPINSCSSYTAYKTGFIPISTVVAENHPQPANVHSAVRSATTRCFALWSSATAYANAGCKSTAQLKSDGSGYDYTCWKCKYYYPVFEVWTQSAGAMEASELATEALPGQVMNVTKVEKKMEDEEVREIYAVSVINGEPGHQLIQEVLVDPITHEVTVQEIVPESGSCE